MPNPLHCPLLRRQRVPPRALLGRAHRLPLGRPHLRRRRSRRGRRGRPPSCRSSGAGAAVPTYPPTQASKRIMIYPVQHHWATVSTDSVTFLSSRPSGRGRPSGAGSSPAGTFATTPPLPPLQPRPAAKAKAPPPCLLRAKAPCRRPRPRRPCWRRSKGPPPAFHSSPWLPGPRWRRTHTAVAAAHRFAAVAAPAHAHETHAPPSPPPTQQSATPTQAYVPSLSIRAVIVAQIPPHAPPEPRPRPRPSGDARRLPPRRKGVAA